MEAFVVITCIFILYCVIYLIVIGLRRFIEGIKDLARDNNCSSGIDLFSKYDFMGIHVLASKLTIDNIDELYDFLVSNSYSVKADENVMSMNIIKVGLTITTNQGNIVTGYVGDYLVYDEDSGFYIINGKTFEEKSS